MAQRKRNVSLVAAILLIGVVHQALGQANCALRNPDRQIYEIFPDATSYRTVESEVNEENRRALEQKIGSRLAPTDLGVHSAYVVLNGKVPIGLVHARSEIGARGSIELVWGMDIDLTITEFRVQRSRERQTKAIQSDKFRSGMVGRNLADLRELLSNGNDEMNLSLLDISADSAAIAHTAVLCALKTRVITEYCFGKSIVSAQIISHANQEFADVGKVSRVRTPLSAATLDSVRQQLGRDPDQIDLATIDIFRVRDTDDHSVGVLIRADWKAHPESPAGWWAITRDGALRHATIPGRRNEASRQEIQALAGVSLEGIEDDGTESNHSSRRLVREVLALAAACADDD